MVEHRPEEVIRLSGNNQHQQKNGYKFNINNRSNLYDLYNCFWEVRFQLQKLDGNGYADAFRVTIINSAHSLIKHLMIKSNGKIIYDVDNLHFIVFVKNLLQYSDDFARSVAKNSFWYLDTDSTTTDENAGFKARHLLTRRVGEGGGADNASKSVSVLIHLNRYGIFEELEDKMLPPMQLQFQIELNDDNELIHKAPTVGAGRVVIDRFILWVPKMVPGL